MQYPWRLLSIVIIITSFLVGIITDLRPYVLVPIIFVALLVVYGGYTDTVVYAMRGDEYYLSNPTWVNGTTTYGNTFRIHGSYQPHTRPDEIAHVISGDAYVNGYRVRSGQYRATVYSLTDAHVGFHTHVFPGWQMYVNGMPNDIEAEQGVVTVRTPPGVHTIDIVLRRTPVQTIGVYVSVIGLLVLVHRIIITCYENIIPHRPPVRRAYGSWHRIIRNLRLTLLLYSRKQIIYLMRLMVM